MSNRMCDVCGTYLEADHDTESNGDGTYSSWYTTVYCPAESFCEQHGCENSTHFACQDCNLSFCEDHIDPRLHQPCPGGPEDDDAVFTRGAN